MNIYSDGITIYLDGIFLDGINLKHAVHHAPKTLAVRARLGLSKDYRGTSLIRNRHPVGSYGRPMPRVPGGS